jgi:hypothetical protein
MQEDIKIFSYLSKLQAAFTAATTDIITSASHGLVEGDLIHVASSTTLPAGLSASTDYYVRDVTTNTFKVSATLGGEAVNVTSTGTGTHTFYLKGKKVLVSDASTVVLSVNSYNSANLKLQVKGSTQDTVDFNAAASPTNRWDYVSIADLNNNSEKYSGDNGYDITGVDENLLFEINVNGLRWITVDVPSATWSVGTIDIKASIYGN